MSKQGQRDITAHEAVVVAQVLGVPLWLLYAGAGYPDHLIGTATAECEKDVPCPIWSPEAVKAARGHVRAYMSGDDRPRRAVEHLLGIWREYETRSGRSPQRAGREAKAGRVVEGVRSQSRGVHHQRNAEQKRAALDVVAQALA